jgi:hypothetical protein
VNPIEATEQQIRRWARRDGITAKPLLIGGPEEGPDVIPCPALAGMVAYEKPDGTRAAIALHHVAYQLDEIELAHLASGGTLWMSTWGGLPIHKLEVEPRDGWPEQPVEYPHASTVNCPGCGVKLHGHVAIRGACLACYPTLPGDDG